MKKTILLLLSSVSILAACYTSPEMNEGRYEDMYIEDESACRYNDDTYQHKGLRKCLETKAAFDSANKKTVQIVQQKDGTALIVPKTYDDSLMLEKNRVYQVVDRDSNAVFVDSSAEVSEKDIAKLPKKADVKEEHSPEPPLMVDDVTITKEEANEGDGIIYDASGVALRQNDIVYDTSDVVYDDGTVERRIYRQSTVVENDNAENGESPVVQVVVEAENPAPPQVIPVVEEVWETQTVEEEDCGCEEDCECDCEEECGCEEEEVAPEADDVNVVMQPSDDEVVISIKTKKKSVKTSEKPCPCKQKKAKKVETFKKNEKEYLPLEEK